MQNELLELVNDEVLTDTSDSILAVLLGVDADNTSGLLALLSITFLIVENALRHVLEKSLTIPASSGHEATFRYRFILFLYMLLIVQFYILNFFI